MAYRPPDTLGHFNLKGPIQPRLEPLLFTDRKRSVPGGRAARLDGSHVQPITDDVIVRLLQRDLRQFLRITRQQRRKRSEGRDARLAQNANGT